MNYSVEKIIIKKKDYVIYLANDGNQKYIIKRVSGD